MRHLLSYRLVMPFCILVLAVPLVAGATNCADYGEGLFTRATLDLPSTDPEAVVIDGDLAFVAAGYSGLLIVDITDQDAPVLLGQCYLSSARDVAVSGDLALACVVDTELGLVVVDWSNPAHPVVRSVADIDPDEHHPRAVDLVGTTAFLATDGELFAVDLTDVDQPETIGSIGGFQLANDVLVIGDEAYLAGLNLLVVDVTDPSQMSMIFTGTEYPRYTSLERLDSYLVAARSITLIIFDIADPAAPAVVGETTTPVSTEGGFAVSGHTIVVANREGVAVVDASVVADPVVEASLPLDGGADHVAASASALVSVPRGEDLGRIAVLDREAVLEHSDCFTVQRDGRGLVVDGIHAYVFGPHTAAVYDVGGSGLPSLIAENDIGTTAYLIDVLAAGGFAYTAEVNGGVGVYDLDPVSGPQRITTLLTNNALDLALSGSTLFVADLEAGIQVVDVTTPPAPTLVRTLPECRAVRLVVAGNELFACDEFDGQLHVYDLSVPTDPQAMAVLPLATTTPIQAIEATADGLLIGTSHELVFVDTTDPSAPLVVGRIDDRAYRILVDADVAYVHDFDDELVIWDVGSLESPAVIGRVALPYVNDIVVDDLGVCIVTESEFSRFPAHCTSGVFAPDPFSATAAIDIYPNPFNMSTTIALRVSEAVVSSVSIHDVRGRLVRQLVDERSAVRGRTFHWDGRDDRGDVASGVYLVRVQSDRGESVQSVTLLK
jgi:hypothetical protein